MDAKIVWDAETKEYAFQLWAYVCNRNSGCVARTLRAENRLPREMPHVRVQEAVAHWAKKYDWRLRVKHDFAAIAPDLRDQMAQQIILGARDGLEYLHEAVKSPVKTDGNKVRVAFGLLDRAGFTPVGRKEPAAFDPPVMEDETALAYTLTPEEIYELQARAGIAAQQDGDDPDDSDDEY